MPTDSDKTPNAEEAEAALERVLNSANHGLAAHGVRRSLGDLDGMEDASTLRAFIAAHKGESVDVRFQDRDKDSLINGEGSGLAIVCNGGNERRMWEPKMVRATLIIHADERAT